MQAEAPSINSQKDRRIARAAGWAPPRTASEADVLQPTNARTITLDSKIRIAPFDDRRAAITGSAGARSSKGNVTDDPERCQMCRPAGDAKVLDL